jgi:prepilin-type N-terminal cleavage/methylation domain-containing protein/prepilin-type processing-associated H-X9-DG protein
VKRAFTLIELLVVIAIIAILAAILFPVFAQAKLAAKKTVSLSNMKQVVLATMMYAGDNEDALPRTMDTSSGFPTTISWWAIHNYQEALNPYIRMNRGGVDANNQVRGRGSVWFDPADPDAYEPAMWGSYSDNGYMTGTFRVMTSVAEPSATVYATLRGRDWARITGATPPSPLPTSDPNHPFWVSEYFDMCLDPWMENPNPAGIYHWSQGLAAPPCSLFPNLSEGTGDGNCSRWDELMDKTRYSQSTNYSFLDGHTKALPFPATYRRVDENMWDIH